MNLNYKIPATNLSYQGYTSSVFSQIKSKTDSITSAYGSIINNISKITNTPTQIITSFIFIESSGNPNAISSAGAVGLMQLIPSSANGILVLENMKKRLRPEEIKILTKYLGSRFTDGILKMKYLGHKVTVGNVKSSEWITREDLLKPELNILIGSIYLSMLIDEESANGNLRLDRVVVRYNKGYFSKLIDGDINKLLTSNLPQETKNYILKLTGKNGVLDAIV